MRNHKFPIVKGTEHWPHPLLDMPDIHIETSAEQHAKLDSAMRKIRQAVKDRDFGTNYGTHFVAAPGDSIE